MLFIPGRRLVNLRWTFSVESMSFTKCGHQTTEQYSKIGRTYTLKALVNDKISLVMKHLKIKLARLCALDTILFTL